MITDYQKQLNRVYFFSNKIATSGKIDYKPKFKSMNTLMDKLRNQLEEKITEEIEKELNEEQVVSRLRIYLPGIIPTVDIESTRYKDYHKMLIDANILTRKDINNFKDLIKTIIDDELTKFLNKPEKPEEQKIVEQLEQQLEEQDKNIKKSKRSSDKDQDKKAKLLIESKLKNSKNDKLTEKDLDDIFNELKIKVTHWKLADLIYELNRECKIPPKLHNLQLESADEIATIVKDEFDIVVSKYIIQAIMGRNCGVHELKNTLSSNYNKEDCEK